MQLLHFREALDQAAAKAVALATAPDDPAAAAAAVAAAQQEHLALTDACYTHVPKVTNVAVDDPSPPLSLVLALPRALPCFSQIFSVRVRPILPPFLALIFDPFLNLSRDGIFEGPDGADRGVGEREPARDAIVAAGAAGKGQGSVLGQRAIRETGQGG